MMRWLLGGLAMAFVAAGIAAPASAEPYGPGRHWQGDRHWGTSLYPPVAREVWCPPVYETVCRKVWHEPCHETVCRQVWRPPVTIEQPYTYCDLFGRHRTAYRTVVVTPGHYKTVHERVLVKPGWYEDVTERVLVKAGHFDVVYDGGFAPGGRLAHRR